MSYKFHLSCWNVLNDDWFKLRSNDHSDDDAGLCSNHRVEPLADPIEPKKVLTLKAHRWWNLHWNSLYLLIVIVLNLIVVVWQRAQVDMVIIWIVSSSVIKKLTRKVDIYLSKHDLSTNNARLQMKIPRGSWFPDLPQVPNQWFVYYKLSWLKNIFVNLTL